MAASALRPRQSLPHNETFASSDEYVDSLLEFVSTNDLLRTLCGGVHVLDFFTTEPSLYSQVLPQEWRDFFAEHEIMDSLDLLMRENLDARSSWTQEGGWREGPAPPESLVTYITSIRQHLLVRDPNTSQCSRNRAVKSTQKLARHVAVGMTVKKIHEVGVFASYIDNLASSLSESTSSEISHLVDFGSGQNYLGRALASEPYRRNVVAIESKEHNADRAKEYDVMAKLVEKEKVMRNKKAFRAGLEERPDPKALDTPPSDPETDTAGQIARVPKKAPKQATHSEGIAAKPIHYVNQRIHSGDLRPIISNIPDHVGRNSMVMSLHSCGNLVHHGLRSLILNPTVRAVAMVGCCYNLLTERLGPATYKLPQLRPTGHPHRRREAAGEARDPDGFPMSESLCTYGADRSGIRLNITARMMAVQAPQNWGERDSESFFTRHFFRALLQRMFLDRGVVGPPSAECVGGSPAGHSSGGTPIVIGALRKACYKNFVDYVRGALAKLSMDSNLGPVINEKMADISDAEIAYYEIRFQRQKKELSVIWSLMAFSAGVIEATIVADRWLWLKEQEEVRDAWVEPVFDYRISPRNLVVVGVKK